MRALGIDLSTSNTGLVVLDASATKVPALIGEFNIAYKKLSGIPKYQAIVGAVIEKIDQFKPDRIVIEGYSLNMKNASSVIPLVEIGGMMRHMMFLDGHQWIAPRATELKQFVCNNGQVKKSMMMMHVLQRWGHQSASEDTADAYGLACIGLAFHGKLPGITQEMRKIIGKLQILCS